MLIIDWYNKAKNWFLSQSIILQILIIIILVGTGMIIGIIIGIILVTLIGVASRLGQTIVGGLGMITGKGLL